MPTLVLDGDATLDFLRDVSDSLHKALPNAQRQTLPDQNHSGDPAAIAPALTTFFNA